MQLPVDSTGVAAAGVAAIVGWAFGSANIALLWIVGLAMLMDLVVGAMRAIIDPLDQFSIGKLYGGFLGKIFRLMLIPTLSLVDWLYIASPMPLPAGYPETFPITTLGMLALAAAEITSTLAKFRDGGVAPSLIAVVVRHLDRMRTGEEPPTRRHYDPPAIAAEIEVKAEQKKEKDP